MSNFKVGDRVRVINNVGNSYFDKYIGKDFKVLDIVVNSDDTNTAYMLNCPPEFTGTTSTWEECELELLEPLPQPQKSLLKSGDKVMYRSGSKRYVLVETGCLYVENGMYAKELYYFTDDLLESKGTTSEDIMQVYRNDELIMERTKKSEKEIRREEIEAEMAKLQKELDELR
jgi:hypothetical protein